MKNIAVFASGNGTNLQAIIDAISRGKLRVKLSLVVSDKKNAFALKRAIKAGIPAIAIDPSEFSSKEEHEKKILSCLTKEKIDLVVLAGYMRILSPFFIRRYKNRILNIHPSILPAFKGGKAIKDAYVYGVKITGVTVHFVDEKVDSGPIVAQQAVVIADSESEKDIEAKIHKVEHGIYPEAIKRVTSGRFVIKGRKVLFS